MFDDAPVHIYDAELLPRAREIGRPFVTADLGALFVPTHAPNDERLAYERILRRWLKSAMHRGLIRQQFRDGLATYTVAPAQRGSASEPFAAAFY